MAEQPLALITGASAGLGAEFARSFARDGKGVVLVARRRDRLDALSAELKSKHSIRAEVLVADLEAPDGPRKIFEETTRRGLEIGYLVNNAGFGTSGPFAQSNLEREVAEMQVNMRALTELTRLFLPAMLARKSGRILNVGSTAGFQPGPYMAVYYATKAYVGSFSEALAYELRDSGVTLTLSCPGPTETEFGKVARIEKKKLFNSFGRASAASVADEAYRAMMSGRRRVIHGWLNRFLLFISGLSPRGMGLRVAGALNQE